MWGAASDSKPSRSGKGNAERRAADLPVRLRRSSTRRATIREPRSSYARKVRGSRPHDCKTPARPDKLIDSLMRDGSKIRARATQRRCGADSKKDEIPFHVARARAEDRQKHGGVPARNPARERFASRTVVARARRSR